MMTSAAACPLPGETSSSSPTPAAAEVIDGELVSVEECWGCELCCALCQASA